MLKYSYLFVLVFVFTNLYHLFKKQVKVLTMSSRLALYAFLCNYQLPMDVQKMLSYLFREINGWNLASNEIRLLLHHSLLFVGNFPSFDICIFCAMCIQLKSQRRNIHANFSDALGKRRRMGFDYYSVQNSLGVNKMDWKRDRGRNFCAGDSVALNFATYLRCSMKYILNVIAALTEVFLLRAQMHAYLCADLHDCILLRFPVFPRVFCGGCFYFYEIYL